MVRELTDKQTDGQTDRHTDRWIDRRQKFINICCCCCCYWKILKYKEYKEKMMLVVKMETDLKKT